MNLALKELSVLTDLVDAGGAVIVAVVAILMMFRADSKGARRGEQLGRIEAVLATLEERTRERYDDAG